MELINDIKIDERVSSKILKWKKEMRSRDKDKFIVVDGREGSGKSSVALQWASAFDDSFNLSKVAFNAKQFDKIVKDPARKKGECIVLDEGYGAINSRATMSSVNRSMVQLGTEMRQLNLFVIIVLPSFFDLDRYFGLWRSDILLHVYIRKNGRRGRYCIYPFNKKKALYLKGKKTYNYFAVRTKHKGFQFNKGYGVLDDVEYRSKKATAFREEEIERVPVKTIQKESKIKVLRNLMEDGTERTQKEYGKLLGVTQKTISKYLLEIRNRPHTLET